MKKLMGFLIMVSLRGNSLSSMEPEVQQVTSIDEQGFAYNMSRLPQELRQLIVTLSLQLEVGKTYELFNQVNTKSIVNSVAFSPNGKTVLTGSSDKTARLWDVNTGQEIKRFTGHTDLILSVAFSPDGRTVLTGSWDTTARLWDIDTGKELQQFAKHNDWVNSVNSVAFSPDGKTVLTGPKSGTVSLWDGDTGQELRLFIGHTSSVNSVTFSPDGKTVLTGSHDTTALLQLYYSSVMECRYRRRVSTAWWACQGC